VNYVAASVVAHRASHPLSVLRERPAPSPDEAAERWRAGLVRSAQVVQLDLDTFAVAMRPGLWRPELVLLHPTARDYASAFRFAVLLNRLYPVAR
jgi:hypothetical protein